MNTVTHKLGINTISMQRSSKSGNQMASSVGTNASTSSLKSDKSDNISPHRTGGGGLVNQSGSSSRSRHGKTGLRDIFRVKLPNRKKLSSPEEAILATLDSAIDSGAAGSSNSNTYRKQRKKRSGRSGSGVSDSVNRNGTWPRVLANRVNNSYTLPHNADHAGGHLGLPEPGGNPSGPGGSNQSSTDPNAVVHHERQGSSFYGPYSLQSNTVCVRRKERPPISSLIWDSLTPNPAKSVGAISTLPGSNKSGGGRFGDGNNTVASAVIHPPHHRYSFGVFDPSPSSAGKINKRLDILFH